MITAAVTWYGKSHHRFAFRKKPELSVFCRSGAFAIIHKTCSAGASAVTVLIPDTLAPDSFPPAIFWKTDVRDIISVSTELPFSVFSAPPAHWMVSDTLTGKNGRMHEPPSGWPVPEPIAQSSWQSRYYRSEPFGSRVPCREIIVEKLRILYCPDADSAVVSPDTASPVRERFDLLLIGRGTQPAVERIHARIRPYFTLIPASSDSGNATAYRTILSCGMAGYTFTVGKNRIPALQTAETTERGSGFLLQQPAQ